MRYTQLTDQDIGHMLDVLGAGSIDELFEAIPEKTRLGVDLSIPRGISELELLADTEALAQKNNDASKTVCFLGGGAYDHFIPTLVDAMASQTEFLTAYTPYQAEASQGMLQLFYEFQTMICELTSMDVANASLYEGATAAAEAVLMARAITRRKRVVVAESVHPDTLRVLRTYVAQQDMEVVTVAAPDGVIDADAFATALNDQTAAVLVQSPNFYGCIERIDRLIPQIHEHGALAIVATDPIACGMLAPPGKFEADIVVGEGQALGVPMQYGGPYLGLLACREKYLRKMPGRIVGLTKDVEGRRGFCLALQTREQHIKRERATSNICTNQGLLAVRAAIYMAAMGRKGIAQVASQSFDKAHYAAGEIAKLAGFELRFAAPFFKEFVVRTTKDVDAVLKKCRDSGIAAGVPMKQFDDAHSGCFMVAVTEKRTKAQIDALVNALKDA